MTGEEAEAFGLFAQKHRAEVAVALADLAVFRDRAGDAEGLEADADVVGSVRSLHAVFLEGDADAEGVRPGSVLKRDGLDAFDDLVDVDALFEAVIPDSVEGFKAIFLKTCLNFRHSSFLSFKNSHLRKPP